MSTQANTRSNLPAQIDLYATEGDEYHFLCIAKGGGSANKTFLFQQTKALLNEKSLEAFLEEKIKTLGTAGRAPRQRCLARCPLHCLPHHGGS